MSYPFEDNSDIGMREGGTVETSAHLTRGGVPRWLMAVLGVAAVVLFFVARSNLPAGEVGPPPTAPTEGFPTTTGVPASATTEIGNDVLVTSPPNQLTHADEEWQTFGVGPDRSIAVRSNNSVLVINPTAETAHRIELPQTGSDAERVDFDGQTISLVAGKLITYDDGFLRSLSVNGGVDVLLSNFSLGFEVATPTAIVAATEIISSSNPESQIRLVPQGVHFPSGRDQVVGAFGVADLDELPAGAKVVAVQEKIFVLLDGEVHRKTPDGLVSLGAGRVFAASEGAVIMERCVVLFEECSYSRIGLDDIAGSEVELDVSRSFAHSEIVMSDDGRSLLMIDDLNGRQTLVDISGGDWNVVHEFDLGRFSTAAFDEASGNWILALPGSLVFWDGTSQGAWQIPGLEEITEITISRQLG